MAEVPNMSLQEGIHYDMNHDINPELKAFLDNKALTSEEAQVLTQIFNANVGEILDYSADNLALLKEAIKNTTGIDTGKSSLIRDDVEKKIIVDIANGVYEPKDESTDKEIKEEGTDQEFSFSPPLYSVGPEIEVDTQDEYILSERAREREFGEYEFDAEPSFEDFFRGLKQKMDDLSIKEVSEIFQRPWLVASLQVIVGTTPDGLWGNNSQKAFNRFVLETEGVDSLEDIITQYNLGTIENKFKDFSYDEPLGSEENFRKKYGEFTAALESNLGFPRGGMVAIIKKESSFGVTEESLNSNGGSKGLTQLTKWPFEDMRGLGGSYFDKKKVQVFQAIVKDMKLNNLKGISTGDGKTIQDTMPDFIWKDLETIATTDSPDTAAKIFTEFQVLIKLNANKNNYVHVLNQIIGAIFLKYHYQKQDGSNVGNLDYGDISVQDRESFRLAARDYNSDTTLITAKSGNMVETRDSYSRTVMMNLRNEHGLD